MSSLLSLVLLAPKLFLTIFVILVISAVGFGVLLLLMWIVITIVGFLVKKPDFPGGEQLWGWLRAPR